MSQEMILEAFGAESERLCEVLSNIDDAAIARGSGCPPWSVAELAYHVRRARPRLRGRPGPGVGVGSGDAAGAHRHNRRGDAMLRKLTGRRAATPAEQRLIESFGSRRLALG